MWVCEKCKREFKNKNQNHFCGENPKTIEEYILLQEEEKQEVLWKIKDALHQALPNAKEKISWSMPTYWEGHNICHFAAFKEHIGFYPGAEAIQAFENQLKAYSTSKGSIRMPYESVDTDLLVDIAKWVYKTYILEK